MEDAPGDCFIVYTAPKLFALWSKDIPKIRAVSVHVNPHEN
jgi:hypothetical protein